MKVTRNSIMKELRNAYKNAKDFCDFIDRYSAICEGLDSTNYCLVIDDDDTVNIFNIVSDKWYVEDWSKKLAALD